MPVFSYEYPKAIRDILQDAKPVELGRHHGNSMAGSMWLFRGKAGRFIVHMRHDKEAPVPAVRLMQLPDEVTDAESIQYAQAHPEAFSRWHYMTCMQLVSLPKRDIMTIMRTGSESCPLSFPMKVFIWNMLKSDSCMYRTCPLYTVT